MRIFICGIDGYLGWAFRCRMMKQGHQVDGCDNYSRRMLVDRVGSDSALPINSMVSRGIKKCDIADNFIKLKALIEDYQPETIIHLAEMPSAPYSMKGVGETTFTQYNNIQGTLNLLYAIKEAAPNAHLVKLGTMGEYGTPNIDITEGDININHNGREDLLPFPCKPLSFYHASKVADSINIRLACKLWGIRCTDIMQGIVYGTSTPETKKMGHTRFDFDECFGTVINRFCAQAVIEHPLTVYGGGNHKRALLPLQDSMQCLDIICHNPPEQGEYRLINQFEQYVSMVKLAWTVRETAQQFGISPLVTFVDNPRVEMSNHYYNPERKKLIEMGYKPNMEMDKVIYEMIADLLPYKNVILKYKESILPKTRWAA